MDPEFHYGINDGQEVAVDIPDGRLIPLA